jgi:hypothetical protein
MAVTKDKSVSEIALEYRIDGASLRIALNKAREEHKKASGRTARFTRAEMKSQNRLLEADYKKHLTKMEGLAKKSSKKQGKSFSDAFSNFGNKIGTISAYGAAIAIIGTLTKAVTFAVTKTIEYEKAFVDLKVKAGLTSKEMSKVAKSILETAQASKFSTLEIIEGATALGKLGFSANEIIDVLPQVAAVSAATGESLEQTSEILGKVIRAYDFTADQAGIISDRMVDIFNNSALNLEKFNTAFSYVGAASASTGTSFDELTAGMAILADRGITASKIGTGLRNVFVKLGASGDDLRDILVRVNQENLTFYEVAELVGRRAANQLFILADSIGEFDEKVADSLDDFGTAVSASAEQMSTFAAQWDIFVNTITNSVAAPQFDPEETLRTALDDTISKMMLVNALLSDGNAKASVSNIVFSNKDIREDFRDEKESGGGSDKQVINRLRGELSNESKESRREKIALEGELKDARKTGNLIEINRLVLLQNENAKIVAGYKARFDGLMDLETLSDRAGGNSLSDSLIIYDEEKVKNGFTKLEEEVRVQSVSMVQKFQRAFGEADAMLLVDAMIGNEDHLVRDMLDRLKEVGSATEDEIKLITNNILLSTEDTFKKIKFEQPITYIEFLKNQHNEQTSGIDNIPSAVGVRNLTQVSDLKLGDIGNIKERIIDLEKTRKQICEVNPKVALELGYSCEKAKKARAERGDIGRFDKNVVKEEEYKTKKNALKNNFKDAEDNFDVEAQREIRNAQIDLEKEYRKGLNDEFKAYLEKQISDKEEFIRKFPKQEDEFNRNIDTTKNNQIKGSETGKRNIDNLLSDEVEAKAKKYTEDVVNRQQYVKEMAILRNQLNSQEVTPEERKDFYDKMNATTDKYYDSQIISVKDALTTLNTQIKGLEAINVIELDEIGADAARVEFKKLEAQVVVLKGLLAKYEADKVKGQKVGGAKGDEEDVDLFALAMEASENLYNVYSEAGDRELERLQLQTDRELEIINNRFEQEGEIRNAALNSGIITMEQSQMAEERAQKRKIDSENKVNKKLFEAQKKKEKQDAIFNGIASTAQAVALAFAKNTPIEATIMASISAAAIAVSTVANIAAISKKKFVPQKYADGGIVNGRSHAQGGVPFSINGSGGYEMEGGEFIVNKEATKNNLSELERINGKTSRSNKRKWAEGGVAVLEDNNNSLTASLLEALNRPVRAYVTDQDLANSESERSALSAKTTY